MKRWALLVVLGGLMVSTLMLGGCEWGSVTDDVSGSSDGTNGNNGNNNDGNSNTNQISDTEIAFSNIILDYGEAGRTAYSGVIVSTDSDNWPGPMVSGSFTISAGGFHFTDNGNGTLAGTVPGTDGTVEYDTGSWSIDLGGADIVDNEPIYGSYVCLIPNSDTNSP